MSIRFVSVTLVLTTSSSSAVERTVTWSGPKDAEARAVEEKGREVDAAVSET
jgi:hypothetical protein